MIKSKTSKMLMALSTLNTMIEEMDNPDKDTATMAVSSPKLVNYPPDDRRSEAPHGDEPIEDDEPFTPVGPVGRSLFIFSEHSRVRQWAYNLIAHPYFDSTILVLITVSSITLAMDNPLANPASNLSMVLTRLDTVFAIMFTLEMVVKIIALGLVMHKGAYLRNNWNILDGAIVISSLVMLVMQSSGNSSSLKSLRSLRTFRTFRPLRMISRRPGLKLVVNALIEAIPAVLNVLFLCGLFYLIFSIVAVNYLKGRFYSCSGDVFDALSVAQQAFLTSPQIWSTLTDTERQWFAGTRCEGFPNMTTITSRYVCECWSADWRETIPQNFNNVGTAMLTFFEISTTEGWADVMMTAIDSTSIDMQPIRDNNMIWALFFVAFIMVGSFFVVNLFVGVIIDNFNRMKAALGGDFMLTPEQRKWIEAQKTASRVGPIRILKPSKHPLRRAIFFFVQRQRFEWTIMICIIVNTVMMGSQYFGQSTVQSDVMDVINNIFAAVFTTEAVLKFIAYGSAYFEDKWNKFDFCVVIATLASNVVESLTGTHVKSLAMIVRVIRVTRILRLVKASKGIRHILLTLYIALPGLSNITSILFLMLFIYATMGVQMFATVALGDNIDTHTNFQNFGTAFLFLMRAATGEAWNACMHDLASSSAGCVESPSYDPTMCGFNNSEGCVPLNGCGNPIAYIFFCSFTLLITYVMLNVTIAVILEGFSLSHEDEEPLFEPELLQEFQSKWSCVDPRASGFIRVARVWALVALLEPPLVKTESATSKIGFLRYTRALCLPLVVTRELGSASN
jgi:voltage-dependent calcium channel L type alpha-1D